MITLKVNGKAIELNTHEVDGKTLYKAQDLLKGYGLDVAKTKQKIQDWKESVAKKCGGKFLPHSIQRGNQAGTYLTKRDTLKLAGYVSYEFEDAVYEAFELLADGKVNEAVDVAVSVVVTQAMIDKEKALRAKMNEMIDLRCDGDKYAHSNFNRLITKCISGYTPNQLKGDKTQSTMSYLTSLNHVSGVGAYLSAMEKVIMGLAVGNNYHQIAAIIGVETGKNKDIVRLVKGL